MPGTHPVWRHPTKLQSHEPGPPSIGSGLDVGEHRWDQQNCLKEELLLIGSKLCKLADIKEVNGKTLQKEFKLKKKQQNPPSTLGSNTTSRTYYSLSWFYFSWIFKIYYLLSEYCWYLQFPMRKIKCVISAVHLLEIPCLAKKGMLCLHFDTSAKKYTNHKL